MVYRCMLMTLMTLIVAVQCAAAAPAGEASAPYWPFAPAPDPFEPSPIDLRSLNQEVAGTDGFVVRDGDRFVFSDTQEAVRFWAVVSQKNVGRLSHEEIDYMARRFAKAGVNMYRVLKHIGKPGSDDPNAIDEQLMDNIHYIVAAMKKQGIYTHLDIYIPVSVRVTPAWGLPGFEEIDNRSPFSMLFWHPRMQQIYRAWLRKLFLSENPYTGTTLADDPAVALYTLANEDNFFFWTFNPGKTIPYECMEVLEKRFGDWAARRYGSLKEAFDSWDFPNERDSLADGRAGLMSAWQMTTDFGRQEPGSQARVADQVRFITRVHHGWYRDTIRWLRDEIGLKCAVVGSKWHTADETRLGALNKYATFPSDVMDVNGFFNTPYIGEPARRWGISRGDVFKNRLATREPETLVLHVLQYEGYPQTISSYSWTAPNRYRAECAFLGAAYGALQGIDGIEFFSASNGRWAERLQKWPLMTPSQFGQFPATALLYRRGDVRQADVVVKQMVSREQLFHLKGSGTEEPFSIDDWRAKEVPEGRETEELEIPSIDPLAYLTGPVVRGFDPEGTGAKLLDLSRYINREARTVRSMTGQILLDYGAGLVTVDSPRSQGACGLLGEAAEIALHDVIIESANEYGSVLVTSLTDEPISSTPRLLLQVITEEQNSNWRVEPHGEGWKIADPGGAPLQVRAAAGSVGIKGSNASGITVTALDQDGYPLDRRVAVSSAGAGMGIRVELEPDVLYYIIERP